jgi:hypothetical protein
MKFLKWSALTIGGLFAALIVLGLAVGPADGGLGLASAAQQQVRAGLRDPGSAQFRNVRVIGQRPYERAVCGELNARNALGGYTGFQGFVATVRRSGDQVFITRIIRQEAGGEFAVEWRVHCV